MSKAGVVSIGDVIAEKYRVERVLGRGGMGVVVAATHMDLGELRAIKLMLPQVAENPEHAQRFQREARISARLKSEHAAKVYDTGRLADGTPYMVMEHLEGFDLSTLRKRGHVPSIQEAARYILQALDALAEAHSLGLVHRDIKHANIFVARGPDGEPCVKVLDFGISKMQFDTEGVTATGQMLGTPAYMAPEQMRGARDLDARADIWALGVLLYWFLTGRYPYEGNDPVALIARVVSGEPPLPPSAHRPELPPSLDALILRCIERDPANRPADVAEIARSLGPFVAGCEALVARIERRLSGRTSVTLDLGVGPAVPPMPSLPSSPNAALITPSAAAEPTASPWQSGTGAPIRPDARRPFIMAAGLAGGLVLLIGLLLITLRVGSSERAEETPSPAANPAPSALTSLPPAPSPSSLVVAAPASVEVAPAPAPLGSGKQAPSAAPSSSALPRSPLKARPPSAGPNVTDRHNF